MINVSCSRTQHSDDSEAGTRGPYVSSQALSPSATVIIFEKRYLQKQNNGILLHPGSNSSMLNICNHISISINKILEIHNRPLVLVAFDYLI